MPGEGELELEDKEVEEDCWLSKSSAGELVLGLFFLLGDLCLVPLDDLSCKALFSMDVKTIFVSNSSDDHSGTWHIVKMVGLGKDSTLGR